MNFRHRVSACTALHFFPQNFIPHRAQLYLDTNPHTLQNFLGADVLPGAAAAVRYVGIDAGTRSNIATSSAPANDRGPRFACAAPRVFRFPADDARPPPLLPFFFRTTPTASASSSSYSLSLPAPSSASALSFSSASSRAAATCARGGEGRQEEGEDGSNDRSGTSRRGRKRRVPRDRRRAGTRRGARASRAGRRDRAALSPVCACPRPRA